MIASSRSNFPYAFRILKTISREVMMQQMSKAGNEVRKNTRSSMKSHGSFYITRVGKHGAYLQKTSGRQFGLRESHKVDGEASSPNSVASMIDSFLMVKSETLVVGGMHPKFRPVLREDGEVKGLGDPVSAVGARTAAILHRMDTGKELPDYPVGSRLYDEIEGRQFMKHGINRSMGEVQTILEAGYVNVSERAVNKASSVYVEEFMVS